MKIIDKLSTYASLIGVIGAIGGGFYAWGEFNTRLSAIEGTKAVDIAPLNDKIANIRVETIDRIKVIEDKLATDSEEGIDEIWTDIEEIQELLNDIKKDVAIVKKENELQDSKIEQIRIKATNPLAN
jgi:hypothetical protein|tara:strand:+ start:1127 stop:1507 length:381 start_codon:yes stop_codon:yes gene_type:complete